MVTPNDTTPLAQEIVAACQQLLAGQLSVVAASRQITGLAFRFHDVKLVHDKCGVFVAIDSETDHLPVGPERRHWAADALAAKDREIQSYEAHYRDYAFEAARQIIKQHEQMGADPSSAPNGGTANSVT